MTTRSLTDLDLRASIATVARIPYTKQLLSNPDYLYNFTDLAIWSTVEIGLALAASSLVTLKPLLRKLKILASTTSNERIAEIGAKEMVGTSTVCSRKLSTLSLRHASKSFVKIEEGTSKSWPLPEEKSVDVEVDVLRSKVHLPKNGSTTNLKASPEEVMETADRIDRSSFALQSPD